MSILKEMGIQQWRRRSARPVVDAVHVDEPIVSVVELNEQAEQQVVNTDLRAALNSQVPTQVEGFSGHSQIIPEQVPPSFDSSASDAPTGGFSGSLRQALDQSISTKQAKKASDKAKENLSEAVESNLADSEQAPGAPKGITPINLSALIPKTEAVSSNVLHELAEIGGENVGGHEIHSSELINSPEPNSSPEPISSPELINSPEPNSSPELINSPELMGGAEPVIDDGQLNSFEVVSGHGPESGHESVSSLLDDSIAIGRDLSAVDWSGLQKLIETNEHCPSCGWGNGHLGAGKQSADWMFIVDAPNSRDIQAQALFSGRAGQLFDAMLSALGLSREQVYSTSVFKCAPTDDLSVTPQCDQIVHRQIQLVSPKVVVTFGEFSAQSIIKSNSPLSALREMQGQHCFRSQVPVIPTYGPAEMLNDTSLKSQVWDDLKQALGLVSN